jgi:hypothetical protein
VEFYLHSAICDERVAIFAAVPQSLFRVAVKTLRGGTKSLASYLLPVGFEVEEQELLHPAAKL